MNSLCIQNNKVIYTDQLGSRVLFDSTDFISNKSRIPLHGNDITIAGIINSLTGGHAAISESTTQGELGTYYLTMNMLMAAFLMHRAKPVRVLEVGCTNGVLSYHIATLLGKFNPESNFCCVCNTVGNESNSRWLDKISKVAELPNLSLVVSDYDNTNLKEGSYDIVVINGSERFKAPDKVIMEAKRKLAGGGLLICFANQQPLLVSAFKLFFSECEEYFFDAFNRIMVLRR